MHRCTVNNRGSPILVNVKGQCGCLHNKLHFLILCSRGQLLLAVDMEMHIHSAKLHDVLHCQVVSMTTTAVWQKIVKRIGPQPKLLITTPTRDNNTVGTVGGVAGSITKQCPNIVQHHSCIAECGASASASAAYRQQDSHAVRPYLSLPRD